MRTQLFVVTDLSSKELSFPIALLPSQEIRWLCWRYVGIRWGLIGEDQIGLSSGDSMGDGRSET